MTEVFYPPVMGLFCAGYVLHLLWRAWMRRCARLSIRQWIVQHNAFERQIDIVWAAYSSASLQDRGQP